MGSVPRDPLTNVCRCSKMQSMSTRGRPALTGMELIAMSPGLFSNVIAGNEPSLDKESASWLSL